MLVQNLEEKGIVQVALNMCQPDATELGEVPFVIVGDVAF